MRKLIRETDPEVVEEWKWRGTPGWYHDGGICTGESSITLNCQVAASALNDLAEAVVSAGFKICANSGAQLASGGEESVCAMVRLTFIHLEPDLRLNIPSVPG